MVIALLILFGIVLALYGGVMLVSGIWLIAVGGETWYYALAGAGILVAGILMALRNINGAWLYFGVFLASAVWAFWEVGFEPWLLMPRLLALAVIAVITGLFVPVLRKHSVQTKKTGA